MRVHTPYREIREDFSLERNELYQKISEMEPNAVANTIPLTWAKAKDFSVFDEKGNKWIDLTSGIFVTNAGHANPLIKDAIKRQVDSDLIFSYNYPTEIKYQFISKLLSISPPYFDKTILLMSGSEAVDAGYKLIKFWGAKHGKKYIVAFGGAYHGRGLSNDLVSGSKNKAEWSRVKDEEVIFLDFPYEETDSFDPSKLPPADQIAGFVFETFQGWGAWFYPDRFIKDAHAFAKKHGALVMFDDMQGGFYRLGPLYGYMTYGEEIKPDILCLGKGITSSLPLSAVLSRKEIVDFDEKADLHGTQSANPVCCAAALADIEFLSDEKRKKEREKPMELFERESKKLTEFPIVKKVNARGMIAGIIFENTEPATEIVKRCIMNGVLPVCTNRNSIKLAPPLTIPEDAILEAFGVIRDAIIEVQKTAR